MAAAFVPLTVMCNLYLCPSILHACAIQARLEVHRFGITGFKKEQQRVFEQDRAVMLGARVSARARHHARINQLFYDFAVVSSSAASEGVRQLQNAAAAEEGGEGRRAASKSSAEPPHL